MNPLIQFKTTSLPLLTALVLAGFAISPPAQGVSPAPDGGYPGDNTAEGTNALFSLTTGEGNTANGHNALFSNSTGDNNTANGSHTLVTNTAGNDNTASGHDALFHNSTGNQNMANGSFALLNNTDGGSNTANGYSALLNNTIGSGNTANGSFALRNNTTGSSNIGLGIFAGFNLTTGSNNIDIGNQGVSAEANTIRIGDSNHTNTYIAGIYGVTITGNPVVVAANGHLGTADISTLQGPPGPQGLQGPPGPITPGSVVMLLVVNGQAPPPPTGYTFKGYTLLAAKPNGGGQTTSYAVYAKD
jgi:hypothetical protein